MGNSNKLLLIGRLWVFGDWRLLFDIDGQRVVQLRHVVGWIWKSGPRRRGIGKRPRTGSKEEGSKQMDGFAHGDNDKSFLLL